MCNDPIPVHCNTDFGKKPSPLLRAAVQNMFTTGLCQCNHTYRDLPLYRCAVTRHQCIETLTLAKSNLHYLMLLCKTCSQQGCVSAIALCRCVQWPTTKALQYCSGQKVFSQLSAFVQNMFTTGLCQCNDTYRDLPLLEVCSDPGPLHCNTVFGKKLLCKTCSQ